MNRSRACLTASLAVACSSFIVACGSAEGTGESASSEGSELSVMTTSASIGGGATIGARAETMAALPAAAAAPATRARISELPTLGGGWSNPAALRRIGLIVGKADLPGGGEHAVTFSRGRITDLGTLGGPSSAAHAVDTRGMIAGFADTATAGDYHAFVYENGTMTDLGLLIGHSSFVMGMNDQSVLVGWAHIGEGELERHAVVWKRATPPCPPDAWVAVDLGDPLGGHTSGASDVNTVGSIVGYSYSATDQRNHALVWPNAAATPVDLGAGDAVAINDAGHIAGNTSQPDAAVMWKDGVPTALGGLGGVASYATDVDESDRVVGFAYSGDTGSARAVVWDNGITDLNTLIDPSLGWELLMANTIGRDGAIAGLGIHNGLLRGFVLTMR
jgi:probable HAF family extracellular repeat protein